MDSRGTTLIDSKMNPLETVTWSTGQPIRAKTLFSRPPRRSFSVKVGLWARTNPHSLKATL